MIKKNGKSCLEISTSLIENARTSKFENSSFCRHVNLTKIDEKKGLLIQRDTGTSTARSTTSTANPNTSSNMYIWDGPLPSRTYEKTWAHSKTLHVFRMWSFDLEMVRY